MNFKLFFICVKSAVEILMAISLNLYIALGRLGICTILILQPMSIGGLFNTPVFSSIPFFRDLNFHCRGLLPF